MAKGRRRKNGKLKPSKESDSVDTLPETLGKVGLIVRYIEADGNCLFRAFASQHCDDEGICFMNSHSTFNREA
jgi:hypothetical protein